MNNLCPGYYCGPYCNYTDTSCYVTGLDPTDGTAGGRGNLATPGGLTTGLNSSDSTCPSSCCSSANENCFRTLDNTGNKVYPDEEIMLVFGGTTYRQVNYNGDLLFQDCEDISLDLLNETQKTCSEELLNEMWAYSIKRNTWTWIKPDYNALVYSSFKQPSSRYGHACALIHITAYESTSKETITRKYMYMYGGFSYDCATACYDLWRYEISYGPQRFYPSPTSTNTWWNRGNHWTLMQQENTGTTPGERWKHTMISDYTLENLYLFGGIQSKAGKTNAYMNDMWKYYSQAQKWELVIPFGINSITRRVNLWDGTYVDREVLTETPDEYYVETGDEVRYLPSNLNSSFYVKIPEGRAGHSMNLIGNPPYFILIYGGQNIVTETKSSSSTITVRTNLDDLWVFSIYSNKWNQVYVNSAFNPSIREESVMVTVNIERLAIMYGGFYADNAMSEMWYFNLFNNMWQQLSYTVDSSISNSVNPPGLRGHTIVNSSIGLIMYGGETWRKADLTVTDKDYERKSVYLSNCQEVLTAAGLTYKDIGTTAYQQAYAKTGNSCFSETTPFLPQYRSVSYNTDIYLFPTNTCNNNCNNRGTCSYGRCTCTGIYYGSECQYIKCPNSLCFVDIDTVDPQECYHCSSHGTCLGTVLQKFSGLKIRL